MAADRLPEELIRRIREDAEFRRLLLEVLLGEEFLQLPAGVRRIEQAVDRLIEAMERDRQAAREREARIDEQIERLGQRIDDVARSIDQLASRVETQIEALTQRMERVEDRLGSVEERVSSLEERVGSVEDELVRVRNRLDELTGKALEQYYRERAPAIFGRRLRRVRAMTVGQLAELITERLPGPEGDDLFEADLVVSGRLSTAEQPEVWVVIEVSATVDRTDVERAVRRAAALRQLHPLVLPGVAGVRLTEGGRELASEAGVIVITDGKVAGFEAALARWLPSDEAMDDALG